MNTALLRRAPECASDLTIDRWLLGELARDDDARRLEEHLHHCAQCDSRVRSLRALYAHQRPQHRGPKVAPRIAAPPPAKLGQHGVAQVIILRDGLLVGTEVFTPGEWLLGSDPRCDLVLADGSVTARHARLVFNDGKAAIADLGGGLFVNGFPIATAELRPIDELSVGPFVLRTRVIADRWGEKETQQVARLRPIAPLGLAPAPSMPQVTQPAKRSAQQRVTEPAIEVGAPIPASAAPPRAWSPPPVAPVIPTAPIAASRQTGTGTLREPVPSPHLQLELKLCWQDAVQVARVFTSGHVIAAERDDATMPLWGFGLERTSMRLATGDGQRFQVFVPTGATAERQTPRGWETVSGPAVDVTGPVRLRRGAMLLLATVGPATGKLAAAPVAKDTFGVAGVSAALLVALLATMRLAAPDDDADFTPKEMPRALIRLTMQPKPPEPVKPTTREKDPEVAIEKQPRPKREQRPRGKPPAPPKWAALDRFKRNNLDEISRALDKTASSSSKRKTVGTQTLALPKGSGAVASALGFSEKGTGGIGREGLKGVGGLSGGNLGLGKVGGQLDRAVSRQVGAPPGSIDREKVAAVINAHLSEVQRCYESALLGTQGLRGRVMLEWVIGLEGDVKSARTKTSSLKSPAVESCIIDKLKRWQFPKARGGNVTITYPFVFESSAF